MMRKLFIFGAAVALFFTGVGGASAAKGGGGKPPSTTGPYSLRFYNCAGDYTGNPVGLTVDGFTTGTSVDGGKKAVTLDGANCFATPPSTTSTAAIGFRDFWDMPLIGVSALGMSAQGPFTQGGSPRISVTMADFAYALDSSYLDQSVIYLDPRACGSPNANQWYTADFRNSASCTIYAHLVDTASAAVAATFSDYDGGSSTSYTGVPGHFDLSNVWVPPVSAWQVMLGSGDFGSTWIWYAFAIADEPTVNRVDRIILGGPAGTNVFTN